MAKGHAPYPRELRLMVELVHSGRSPEVLAEEYEPSAESIRIWVKQAERDEGKRKAGLTTVEREELWKLRCENRALREGRSAETLSDDLRAVELTARVKGVRRVASEIKSPDSVADSETWRDGKYDAAVATRSAAA